MKQRVVMIAAFMFTLLLVILGLFVAYCRLTGGKKNEEKVMAVNAEHAGGKRVFRKSD